MLKTNSAAYDGNIHYHHLPPVLFYVVLLIKRIEGSVALCILGLRIIHPLGTCVSQLTTGVCQWGLAVSTLCVFQLPYHKRCFVSFGFDNTCSCSGASMDGFLCARTSCCASGIHQQLAFCTICWQGLANKVPMSIRNAHSRYRPSPEKHARQNGGCVEALLATLLACCCLACALRRLSAHWRGPG